MIASGTSGSALLLFKVLQVAVDLRRGGNVMSSEVLLRRADYLVGKVAHQKRFSLSLP